ncbi:Phosphoserine phosphatase RsbU [Polystyrenella longa]|uniref:Phosphoserine phosphatase RsbU n=1 Tax=Polystyrenella longa TaxID=2528007 RepID=A0A518CNJ5_9PLAN|nr:SpoIIE family protein phosphatase [Polystyrenella longa]QDU80764.1 Phosphoserine phosphatase RsbU [Polystyrenella longa]
MKILIAEDELATRLRLERYLEKMGYEPTAVENGAQAWELFQEGGYSLVLTDWMMPEMDGLELVRRIRSMNRDEYTYVIMLTSKSETSEIVEGMETGADDFVTKPFDRNELRVRVRAGERIVQLERSLAEHNLRMKSDLDSAADLQKSLLPVSSPDLEGVSFAWKFRPCDELAGDILGAFKLDEEHVGFYVADVSGHGVAAALLSVSISRMMNSTPSISSLLVQPIEGESKNRIAPPSEVLRELNRRFPMEESGGKFFTMAYGILNVRTRELQIGSAGHNPAIRVSQDQPPTLLDAEGILVGAVEDYEYEDCHVQLSPGDRLFVYSDGVVEQANPDGEQYGEERLQTQLAAGRSKSITEGVRNIEQQVVDWSGNGHLTDDLSILALEVE